MDEQHVGLCLPIPVAGNLFRSISLLMFIYIQFTIVTSMLCVQFIREYTSKVDDLVKDKIESQKGERAKEKEEKDLVAQQVT